MTAITRNKAVSLALGFAAAGVFAAPATAAIVTPAQIAEWATEVVQLTRGPQDIANPGLGLVTVGTAESALGARDGSVVSLGDGGSIVLSFAKAIFDGPGDDFAVFENGFASGSLVFAELAFVSVSSNGSDWLDFQSRYDGTRPVSAFGTIDPASVHNLAGQVAAPNGTGFDLSELTAAAASSGGTIDLNAIRFVRLVDVVGNGSTTDSFGNPIYDPYPTGLASSGFDLDAVGAIHVVPLPAAVWLFGSALAGVAGMSARRRAARSGE